MAFKDKKNQSTEKNDSEMVRRFKQSPFIFIGTFVILVIVIIAFVLVPAIVPQSGGANVDLTFGYYDKMPITYVPGNYLAQYYDTSSRYWQSSMSTGKPSDAQIWQEAFEAAAIHTAILREMGKAGYKAPEKTVDRSVAGFPQFQENGRFSAALYRQMDNNSRLSLWRQEQDNIAKNHYRNDVVGLHTPAAEGEFIGKMASLQRSFEMAVFPVDNYPEEQYTAFIKEHPELFRSVHLSMLTISSNENEARQLLSSIKNGETTFEDAAKAHSKDSYADKGGDMGIKMVYELSTDIAEGDVREKAAVLGQGEYSDVLKTAAGWSFFRAEEAVKDADAADSAVMDKVRSYMRNQERGRMEDYATTLANDFVTLAGEAGFSEAVSQQGVQSRTFGPIPVNYGNIDLFTTLPVESISELSLAASDENFWNTAFSTPVGTPSTPVVQGSNVLVLYPTEETQAEDSTVESIASTYNAVWASYLNEQSIQQYFLNNPKFENNFLEVYLRYFLPQGE